jgi:hypothetical protein
MLSKLDDLCNRVLYESVEDKWIRKINSDNEFFAKYLKPLTANFQPGELSVVKARWNTFLFSGLYQNVIEALKNFSVDTDFWNEDELGGKFTVSEPLVSFGEITHVMNLDEGYPQGTVADDTLYAQRNARRVHYEGRWFELNDINSIKTFGYPVKVKKCTPIELCAFIDVLKNEVFGEKDSNDIYVLVEFKVNCEGFLNCSFGEMSTYVPVVNIDNEKETIEDTLTDKANDFEEKSEEPTAKCELPKEGTENKVKVVQPGKSNNGMLKTPVINKYDPKNKFKKTTTKLEI